MSIRTAKRIDRVSYRAIAHKLGISHNAVKLAMKHEPGMSDEKRQQVVRLARTLNYPGLKDFYTSTVAAWMPDDGPGTATAAFIVEWLLDWAVKVVPCLPHHPHAIPEDAMALLYFGSDPTPLQKIARKHPDLPVMTFFEPVPGMQTNTFFFDGISGWNDAALDSPTQFLCREHLNGILARIRNPGKQPRQKSWSCRFHRPRSGRVGQGVFSGTPFPMASNPRPKTTIAQLAQKIGVSTATISNVLQGKGNVADATRHRIVETAWNEGYRPIHAKRTREIIVFDQWPLSPRHIFNNFCSILNEIAAKEKSLHISHITSLNPEFLQRSIYHMRPDGVILFFDRQDLTEAAAAQLDPVTCPGVSLISPGQHLNMDSVLEDHRSAVASLFERLTRQDCRSFGYLGTQYRTGTAHLQRFQAFKDEIAHRGLSAPEEWRILLPEQDAAKWSPTEPEEHMRKTLVRILAKILEKPARPPDAFICYNDDFAVALGQALLEYDVEGVHICGWGNQSVLEKAVQPVTTVEFDLRALALNAVNLINARIASPYAPLQTILLNGPLVPWHSHRRSARRARSERTDSTRPTQASPA